MNKLVIFHGSDHIIEKPSLLEGKKNNDYGQGFYCTENNELAREWACRFSDGYVNKYVLNLKGLKILNLEDVDNVTMTWLALLLKNRKFDKTEIENIISKVILDNFLIDISSFDVVIGYRADDSYFSFAQSFLNNSLSLEKLEIALKLGMLGQQIVLISSKAFENLTYLESEKVDEDIYHEKYISRDVKARQQFINLREEEISGGTFASDIIKGLKK